MLPTKNYMPQIDALRAFAIIAVLHHHFWEESAAGHLGVRLFFVISGFLITGILIDNHRSNDSFSIVDRLKAFYGRRIIRIFPAYFMALGAATILDIGDLRETFPWHALFLSNVLFSLTGEWASATSHLWSLSVEEQFYIIWPVLVWMLPRKALPAFFCATVAGSVIFRALYFDAAGPEGPAIWVATPAAFDAFAVGALLSLWARSDWYGALSEKILKLLLLPALLLGYWTLSFSLAAMYVWGDLLWLVFAAILVAGSAVGFKGMMGKALTFPPLLFIGRISYGIYLFHLFVWAVALGVARPFGLSGYVERGPLAFFLVGAATIAASAFSWFLMEEPINRLKSRFPYQKSDGVRSRGPDAGDPTTGNH